MQAPPHPTAHNPRQVLLQLFLQSVAAFAMVGITNAAVATKNGIDLAILLKNSFLLIFTILFLHQKDLNMLSLQSQSQGGTLRACEYLTISRGLRCVPSVLLRIARGLEC